MGMKTEGLIKVEGLSLGLEQSLEKQLGSAGVVITDLDDVWFRTSEVYERRMSEVAQVFAPMVGKETEQVFDDLLSMILVRRSVMEVNPLIMPAAVADLYRRYGLEDKMALATAYGSILEIFDDFLPLYAGAEMSWPVLGGLKQIRVAAWTHADAEWTQRKMMMYPGLERVFSGGVFAVDVDKPKECGSVLSSLGVGPNEVVVVGDSLRSDVLTAVEAGVPGENIFWINAKSVPVGEVELPDGVRVVANLWEAVNVMAMGWSR